MTNPITPPPALVQQWLCSDDYLWGPLEQKSITITANRLQNVATQAARWGANQELEACCAEAEWLESPSFAKKLRAARRPKPPSLKERALQAWVAVEAGTDDQTAMAVIRRALEALDD